MEDLREPAGRDAIAESNATQLGRVENALRKGARHHGFRYRSVDPVTAGNGNRASHRGFAAVRGMCGRFGTDQLGGSETSATDPRADS